ncbi:MAG: glycosyl hydrolase, partial [Acidobacteria bacterium]
MRTAAILLVFTLIITLPVWGAQSNETKEDEGPMSASGFAGLELRGIGPAMASGRIGDFAVDPADSSRYFVAVASGGVWKTVNNGTTWTPVFDGEGSYSIGCVEIDPCNPEIIWVGTGENNSQRSVSFGDGVYKSLDGGQSWTNMGLEDSQHIGMIAIDPRDSDIVYVAAQGP